MRLPSALLSALAYGIARDAPNAAPGAASEPAIVEPWRSPGVPDEPDPIAVFLFTRTRQAPGANTPAGAVFADYQAWCREQGRTPVCIGAFGARAGQYTRIGAHEATLADRALIGAPPAMISSLRLRIMADAALVSAKVLAVAQATRDVLEAVTDEPGTAGDVVRLAAAMLDDVLSDAAADQV